MHLHPKTWLTHSLLGSMMLLLSVLPLEAWVPSQEATRSVSPQMPYARIGLIVDDMGDKRALALEFLNLGVPLACAILPERPWSRWLARRAREKDLEVMLHLPMEPHDYPAQDPGPLAVMFSMAESEIRDTVRRAIESVPGVVGVDNHMGSRVTEDNNKMRIILDELDQYDLFYVDSLTTPDSMGRETAAILGLPTAQNRLFLDNERSTEAILGRLNQLGDAALRTGTAIGIAHVASSTVRALRLGIPALEARGIRIVPISELVQMGNTP